MEYLRIAQDLDMYGVHYFPINVKRLSAAVRLTVALQFGKF